MGSQAVKVAMEDAVEIIAFVLNDQQFCVRTTSIREIRGWGPVTPLPHTPIEMLGVMNLRGTVIPIVDLSIKLGMPPVAANERSAIVVTSVKGRTIGLMVDRVADILTVKADEMQPVPVAAGIAQTGYAQAIIAHAKDMICFLDLDAIFAADEPERWDSVA